MSNSKDCPADEQALLHRFEDQLVSQVAQPRGHRLPDRLDAARLFLVELQVEGRQLLRRALVDRLESGRRQREVANRAALLVHVGGPRRDLPLLLVADLRHARLALLHGKQQHVDRFLHRRRFRMRGLDDLHGVLDAGARLLVLRALPLLDGAQVVLGGLLLGFALLLPDLGDSPDFLVRQFVRLRPHARLTLKPDVEFRAGVLAL